MTRCVGSAQTERIGYFATLACQVGSILRACEALGKPDSFLAELRPRPSRTTRQHLETTVSRLALDRPLWDPIQLANELRRQGITFSPATVQAVLRRHRLHSIASRIRTVIALARRQSIELDATQVRTLHRAIAEHEQQVAAREGPGAGCLQDTLCVGRLARVGAVYQQTFIDPAAGRVWAKLYTEKSARVAVDLLEERVLRWYLHRGVPLRRVFTDRGVEFCGYLDEHLYERFLRELGIEHRWTQHASAQRNPACQQLHRQLIEAFYRPRLLGGDPLTLYDLQRALDVWIEDNLAPGSDEPRPADHKRPAATSDRRGAAAARRTAAGRSKISVRRSRTSS